MATIRGEAAQKFRDLEAELLIRRSDLSSETRRADAALKKVADLRKVARSLWKQRKELLDALVEAEDVLSRIYNGKSYSGRVLDAIDGARTAIRNAQKKPKRSRGVEVPQELLMRQTAKKGGR